MSIRFLLFYIGLTCLLACGKEKGMTPEPTPADSVNDGILKVLFIGNSHTSYYDFPKTFKAIMASAAFPDSIQIAVSAPGGFSLEEHAMSNQTLDLLNGDNWDWVVLQENATLAALPQAAAEIQVYPFAAQLQNRIKINNSETKTILYMTHAYQGGAPDCATIPNSCTYDWMQNEIRHNYLMMADRLGAKVAPAGMMWKILLSQKEMNLWEVDTIHPNPTGAYISALTLFASIQEQRLSNEFFVPSFLETTDRDLIFQVINQSIFDENPNWKVY